MRRVVTLDMGDIYLMAMMFLGYTIADVCRKLGNHSAWGSTRVSRLETAYKVKLFDYINHRTKTLTTAGREIAEKHLQALQILVPDYSEPSRVKKTKNFMV